MHHGICTHAGAYQHIEIPGDIPHAVGQIESHPVGDTVFVGVGEGTLQGCFVNIGFDHRNGDAAGEQMDAQISMIAADVSHAAAMGHKACASQESLRKGKFH